MSGVAFVNAIIAGDVALVDQMLRDGYDPSVNKQEAITTALYYENPLIIERLFQDPRVDPTENGSYHFMNILAMRGNLPLLELVLRHPKVDLSDVGNLLLLSAHRMLLCDVDPRWLEGHDEVEKNKIQQKINQKCENHNRVIEFLKQKPEIDQRVLLGPEYEHLSKLKVYKKLDRPAELVNEYLKE